MEKRKNKNKSKSIWKRYNIKWVIFVTFWTLVLAMFMSFIAEKLVGNLTIVISFFVLIFIISIGVLFDMIGLSVATADEKPFHAMAANKVPEAKIAIKMIKNAGPVSNFCNDVVGDICGIISGAIGASIAYRLIVSFSLLDASIISMIMTAIIASFTVGGKAIAKGIAMNNNTQIIVNISKIINLVKKK